MELNIWCSMRIAIISDIHGDFEGLKYLPRDYDEQLEEMLKAA